MIQASVSILIQPGIDERQRSLIGQALEQQQFIIGNVRWSPMLIALKLPMSSCSYSIDANAIELRLACWNGSRNDRRGVLWRSGTTKIGPRD